MRLLKLPEPTTHSRARSPAAPGTFCKIVIHPVVGEICFNISIGLDVSFEACDNLFARPWVCEMSAVAKANAICTIVLVGVAIVVGERKAPRGPTVAACHSEPARLCLLQLEVNLGTLVDMACLDSFLAEWRERRVERDIR